jgi:hypothetical protein
MIEQAKKANWQGDSRPVYQWSQYEPTQSAKDKAIRLDRNDYSK